MNNFGNDVDTIIFNGKEMTIRQIIIEFFEDKGWETKGLYFKHFRAWFYGNGLSALPKSAYYRCIKDQINYFKREGLDPSQVHTHGRPQKPRRRK